jgi:hypothetical protein
VHRAARCCDAPTRTPGRPHRSLACASVVCAGRPFTARRGSPPQPISLPSAPRWIALRTTVRVRDPPCGLDPARGDIRVEGVQVVDGDGRRAACIGVLHDEQIATLRELPDRLRGVVALRWVAECRPSRERGRRGRPREDALQRSAATRGAKLRADGGASAAPLSPRKQTPRISAPQGARLGRRSSGRLSARISRRTSARRSPRGASVSTRTRSSTASSGPRRSSAARSTNAAWSSNLRYDCPRDSTASARQVDLTPEVRIGLGPTTPDAQATELAHHPLGALPEDRAERVTQLREAPEARGEGSGVSAASSDSFGACPRDATSRRACMRQSTRATAAPLRR